MKCMLNLAFVVPLQFYIGPYKKIYKISQPWNLIKPKYHIKQLAPLTSVVWVILCRLPEKERKETEEIAEEMKQRDRKERRTGMKVKKKKK